MGTLNESVTTLGFTVTSLILINCKKDVPMFVKLSLYSLLLSWLWEFLLGSLIPPRLCCVPAPPSPHCLINFCRWQKLTQICVYQEIINISSQVFLSAVFCLLFVWIWPPVLTRASVNERIFCQTVASCWSAQWTLNTRGHKCVSRVRLHPTPGSGMVRGQFKVHIICSGIRRMLFCGDKNACKNFRVCTFMCCHVRSILQSFYEGYLSSFYLAFYSI